MDQVWPWIATLPSSPSADSPPSLTLAADGHKSIVLRAQPTPGPDDDPETPHLTFSISLLGFTPSNTLWASAPLSLSSPHLHHHFLTHLVQELVSLSPTRSILNEASGPRLDVGPIADAINAATESAPSLLTLTLICRLFWLCAVDAPAEAGSLFFRSVSQAVLGRVLDCRPALGSLLSAVGPDWEERFMRSVGYVISKWCILRDLQAGPLAIRGSPAVFCPCYAASAHGLWVLKGYAPIAAMPLCCSAPSGRSLDVKDSVLRYVLAHQQLEAVVQLECDMSTPDPRFIRISVRINNIRLHVVRLGFKRNEEEEYGRQQQQQQADDMHGERHFPSRVRVWVGPELGSAYATGLSLGRSTENPEQELETAQTVKGNFGKAKFPSIKARTRSSVRSKGKSWRWEQDAEGNAAVFEGVLCEGAATGAEVAALGRRGRGMRRRALSRGGGLVVGGDEVGEEVSWRVGREMEGRNLKWRVGGRVWVSYYPSEMMKSSGYSETRCVEWREEVDLPLNPKKYTVYRPI